MLRLRNNFNINLGVNFTKAHFVNFARAFSEHPIRRTTTIKRVIDNGQSIYHPFDVWMAYINDNPQSAVNVADNSTQSMHSYDSGNIDIPNPDLFNNMDEEDELHFHQNQLNQSHMHDSKMHVSDINLHDDIDPPLNQNNINS